MNKHIQLGNEALANGDRETAKTEFYKALADPDERVQRIAWNRLMDLFPETVYASTHSDQQLYHRPNCAARNITMPSHIVHFRDWEEAESAGFTPCGMCRPPRPGAKGEPPPSRQRPKPISTTEI